ncbi:MAG TPA: hypothetical protein VMG59_09645 [Phycisphaerae bacterium]|nr:hypothetical protein [Phycisphaerae bacterium]
MRPIKTGVIKFMVPAAVVALLGLSGCELFCGDDGWCGDGHSLEWVGFQNYFSGGGFNGYYHHDDSFYGHGDDHHYDHNHDYGHDGDHNSDHGGDQNNDSGHDHK